MLAILIQGGGLFVVGIWGMLMNRREGWSIFAGPSPWFLCLGFLELTILVPMISNEIHRNDARAHFYSQEAWDNCKAMTQEAKKQGFDRWTCHNPAPRS